MKSIALLVVSWVIVNLYIYIYLEFTMIDALLIRVEYKDSIFYIIYIEILKQFIRSWVGIIYSDNFLNKIFYK